ncbi:lasso peptide biosynthesis PqqD family chaperone [Paenibacillus aurantius]|uniref:Lasso peptide biosynthesis PqqD family chaperone n=1 Tax=Paenibacillus aurantius TaxID=2918900 RepID=A0AA96LIE5_9BACL|nr:lasso peptide biosynthesis PqqD family chaperone [Paenibacillus aurantius]WNQ12680.1 lasso peptide biosynthesis PqqD family chaperone [Paenibacillus aurantius]
MKINSINTLSDRFSQVPGNIVSDMGEEKVMLSIQNGKYYNLGEIGGRIWELLEQPRTMEEVVAELVSEYEVDAALCREQTQSFLEHMINEQLIAIAGK